MNNRRKKASIYSLIIGVILLCSFIVLPFLETTKTAFSMGGSNSLYAFVAPQSTKAVNGKIYVDAGLSIDVAGDGAITRNDAGAMVENEIVPFESAKIFFRTRNMSAISEAGDYEAIDQSFTVFGTSPYTTVEVAVNYTGLQVGDVARQFIVEIYKVEITGLQDGYTFVQPNESKEISTETLSAGSEFTIGRNERNIRGGYLSFLDLTYYTHIVPHSTAKDVTETTSFNDVKIDLANYPNGWYSKLKYLSDHDMAKLGVRSVLAAYEEANGWYTDNSFVGLQIFGGDSRGVGAPALEGVPDKNVFTSDSVTELARLYAKFQSNERENLTISEAFNGKFEGVTVGSIFDKSVLLTQNMARNGSGHGGTYDAYVGSMDDSVRNDVFLIDDLNAALKGSTTISARVWSYLSGKTKYYDGMLMFVPNNYVAYAKSATLGGIYKDGDESKLGLSLRFSEPVQFMKYTEDKTVILPSLTGYINGNAANELDFQYVSGEGTDTLFFEADVSKYEMLITKVSLGASQGFEGVYDFAPHGSAAGPTGDVNFFNVMSKYEDKIVNGWDTISNQAYVCSYDLREPEIDVNGNIPTTVKTSHTVTIRTHNISESGEFHYAWTNDSTTVPQTLYRESISAQGYQTIFSPLNVSGTRYLYAVAVSEFGKRSEEAWFGPFYFDNDAPTLGVEVLDDSYKQKQFKITISNKTKIDGFEKYVELKKNLKLLVSSDADGKNIVKEFSVSVPDEALRDESVTVSYTLDAKRLGLALGGEKEYGDYYIFFSVSDSLENQCVTEPIAYYFDVRNIFDVELTKNDYEMDEVARGEVSLGKNCYTIDLSKMGEGKAITFVASEEKISVAVEEFVGVQSDVDVSFNMDTGSANGKIDISIKEKFSPGLYRLILQDKASDKMSLPIYFYVTNGKTDGLYQEETGGYQAISNSLAFTNKVFQIPADVPYHYMDATGAKLRQSYSSGGNRPTFFSSWAVALTYIEFRELLDLHAVVLTSGMASDLNRGSIGSYRKADGVTKIAEEGQVWIRYKETNWRINSTTSDWVYYYYGADQSALPINLDALSQELQRALKTVANSICSLGEDVDLVTEEYLDSYGAPMLKAEQMHLKGETSSSAMAGTAFAKPAEYLGDSGMYFIGDSAAPLSTNAAVAFGENRYFYYKTNGSEYRPLVKDDRQTLGEYFNASGRFTILEIDENGVREYSVQIDKSAPKLNLSWISTGKDAKKEYKTFSLDDNGQTISGTNFCIEGIEDEDSLSFVAIYRYTSQGEGDLLSVYRNSDFEKGNLFRFEAGKYHVQVSDRSGNSYIFVLQVKSEPLTLTVREVENAYIRVELNRSEEEVRYQVYLDGRILTTNLRDNKFTESGEYRFVVEDIYGNKEEKVVVFERDLPLVDWRYQLADGTYAQYDFDLGSERINIEKIDEQNYAISTSTYLRFELLDGCVYEILSGDPNPNQNVSTRVVTLNNKVPFTMKVYYEAYPETYVIYTCIIDDSTPQISVSYQKEYYKPYEILDIKEKLESGEFGLGDHPYTPTFIGFTADETKSATLYVTEGQRVQSKYFKVQVSDESGIRKVEVYCDGLLVLTKKSDFSNIYLSRRGSYQILATDNFGNTTTFSFVNEYEKRVVYFVDGEEMSSDVDFADNFIGSDYTKAEYGKSKAEIKLLASAEVHYLITDEDGNTYHFAFVVEDGMVYTFQYVVKIAKGEKFNEEKGEMVEVNEIENLSVLGATPLAVGVIAEVKKIGVAIFLSKNPDGSIYLTVSSTDDEQKSYTVEVRISALENQNEMPYYFKTKMSTIPSSVTFVDEAGNAIDGAQTIKVNEPFAVKNAFSEEIQRVEVAYSQTGNYTEYQTVYDGSYLKKVFKDEGMYHVKVVNKYGITTDYYVVLSTQFMMSATAEYIDGTSTQYSTKYTAENDAFYSNKGVEFVVYATNVAVDFDKIQGISVITTEKGYTIIYVNTSGRLEVEDEYGNRLEKDIYIRSSILTVEGNLLTGINEEALRYDENYTNTKVFISENALNRSEIAYIGMIYGDKTVTLFDAISEVGKDFESSQSVGDFGDGEYTLIFKDRYGNKADRVIHYCGTPTLTIYRTTLNGVGTEIYPLEEMLAHGVWTNDSVSFSISATEYRLLVDGKENVMSIKYDSKTQNEYEVSYLDEYGFKYSFTVYMHRENVVIQPAEEMQISQLSDMLVTKDGVQVIFTEGACCTYTLNNEAEKVYDVGEVLYKDGTYRFRVVDKAGNVSTYTVKKDSAVEYRLEGVGVNETLINGGVTNGNSVRFYAENADNAYIKKVFLNNEFIEYDDDVFTERGKWELIVADDVGNESYFRFYILYGKIDGFKYTAPYNYEITSVIHEIGDSTADASETIHEQGLRLEASENGKYTVTMKSMVTGSTKTFTFTIDKTPPSVELIGCEVGEKTINNITFKGVSVGDTLYVYRDGVLTKTIHIDSEYMDSPIISEAGKYRIVIESEAGVQTELFFERKYIPNVPGSILIIVLAMASVAGLFIGLIWRNHSKTDD